MAPRRAGRGSRKELKVAEHSALAHRKGGPPPLPALEAKSIKNLVKLEAQKGFFSPSDLFEILCL